MSPRNCWVFLQPAFWFMLSSDVADSKVTHAEKSILPEL